eukprot:3162361-Rhodomonas_salina.1
MTGPERRSGERKTRFRRSRVFSPTLREEILAERFTASSWCKCSTEWEVEGEDPGHDHHY